MQTDIDIEEIRGKIGKAKTETFKVVASELVGGIIQPLEEALSLLPKPCKPFKSCEKCGGHRRIKDDANWTSVNHAYIPCPCQAPAGEIEEFVKTFRRWLKALGTTDITNNQVRVKGYQACDILTAQAKRVEELERAYQQYTTGEGMYYHDVICSADRRKPMGCDMCSCEIGHELKRLRAKVAQLEGICSVLNKPQDELREISLASLCDSIDSKCLEDGVTEICCYWMCKAEQLEGENRWIPVSERLPELYDCPHPHSPDVLLLLSEVYLGWFEKDKGWRHGDGTVEVFPTHWKPIILPDQALKGDE